MTITDEEARQVYDYMREQYLDVNRWKALRALLNRIDEHLEIRQAILKKVS